MFSLETRIVTQVDHLLPRRRYSFTESITDLDGLTFQAGEEVLYIEAEYRHNDGTVRLKFDDGRTLFIKTSTSVRHLLLEVGYEPEPPEPIPPPVLDAEPDPEPHPLENDNLLATVVSLARAGDFDAAQLAYRRLLDVQDPQMLAYELRDCARGVPRTETEARDWLMEHAKSCIWLWASWSTSGGEGAARSYEARQFESGC